MMNIWGFVTAAVLLTLMPGPDILFVLTQGMTRGWRAGVVFAAGLCTGLVAHVTAAALGISVLLMSSETAFMALKFAGAAYLLYLALRRICFIWLSRRFGRVGRIISAWMRGEGLSANSIGGGF